MTQHAKHTPGPWLYEPGASPKIVANNGLIICITQSCNARLIASAPRMLELLRSTALTLDSELGLDLDEELKKDINEILDYIDNLK